MITSSLLSYNVYCAHILADDRQSVKHWQSNTDLLLSRSCKYPTQKHFQIIILIAHLHLKDSSTPLRMTDLKYGCPTAKKKNPDAYTTDQST